MPYLAPAGRRGPAQGRGESVIEILIISSAQYPTAERDKGTPARRDTRLSPAASHPRGTEIYGSRLPRPPRPPRSPAQARGVSVASGAHIHVNTYAHSHSLRPPPLSPFFDLSCLFFSFLFLSLSVSFPALFSFPLPPSPSLPINRMNRSPPIQSKRTTRPDIKQTMGKHRGPAHDHGL